MRARKPDMAFLPTSVPNGLSETLPRMRWNVNLSIFWTAKKPSAAAAATA